MKTVDKALTVLDQFTVSKTEIGLSELARMAGLDKAATRRLLVAMAKHGFIEQSPGTRKYRLGHGFLRLARIREATMPLTRLAQDVADALVEEVQESVHISVPGAHGMTTIAHQMPNRGRVIHIVPAQALHYHASASGLAFLAFASEETTQHVLDLERVKVTDVTMTDRNGLLTECRTIRAQGFARALNTVEQDVGGVAMPFFHDGPDPAGCIAIALSSAELTEAKQAVLLPPLRAAIAQIERGLTGF